MVDTCKLVKGKEEPIPQKGNDQTQKWKQFNEYETMNPHEKYRHMIKESLKHEINNIVLDLALKKEKKAFFNSPFSSPQGKDLYKTFNSTYNKMNTTWRSPTIESIERNFNENSRFYSNFKEGRRHGVKFVPKPVTDNIQSLLEEERYEQQKKEIQNAILEDQQSYRSSKYSRAKSENRYMKTLP